MKDHAHAGAILASMLLLPSIAVAQASDPQAIVCSVAGYDVMIENQADTPVAAGTEIHWSVPFVRGEGTHVFEEELAPGGRVFLSTALGASFLDPGRACEVTPG